MLDGLAGFNRPKRKETAVSVSLSTDYADYADFRNTNS
jgi:hypothetical protein